MFINAGRVSVYRCFMLITQIRPRNYTIVIFFLLLPGKYSINFLILVSFLRFNPGRQLDTTCLFANSPHLDGKESQYEYENLLAKIDCWESFNVKMTLEIMKSSHHLAWYQGCPVLRSLEYLQGGSSTISPMHSNPCCEEFLPNSLSKPLVMQFEATVSFSSACHMRKETHTLYATPFQVFVAIRSPLSYFQTKASRFNHSS